MLFIGYIISWVYSKYYAQNVYASDLSLSISNNTSSYFTPNQSINFIWGQGGNSDGVYLKKMLLSRSHNEFLVKELGLFVNYSTKGMIKSTYLDKDDSPVFLEIDKNTCNRLIILLLYYQKEMERMRLIFRKKAILQICTAMNMKDFRLLQLTIDQQIKLLRLMSGILLPT